MTRSSNRSLSAGQGGFGLVDVMVGMVIGLLVLLVIMQVFSVFERQKQTTTGSADAQTNGSIALYTIQRDVQMAGFGLPLFDTDNPPLLCDPSPTVDHDGNPGTPAIDMFPLSITEGGAAAGASDTLTIRYSPAAMGGVPVLVLDPANATASGVRVDNNLSCQNNDIVLVVNGAACGMTRVVDNDLAADTTHITLQSAPASLMGGSSLACIGAWNQFSYAVNNNQLESNNVPVVAGIVNIQVQYGVAALATDSQVAQWVDASGATWATPTVADRNRIRAIRIAVVARNGLREGDNVTAACSSLTAAAPTGLCAWEGSAGSPAPAIDLSNDPDWRRYRYRVYETIIPLRNMLWSRNTLS